MGIDIYMYSEHRTECGWILCSALTSDPGVALPDPLPEGKLFPESIYSTRNRPLFEILAGVGNPFRGPEPFEPIARPRGLPADLSGELAEWVAMFGEPESPSWLLLQELEDFPWDEVQTVRDWLADGTISHRTETYAESAGPEFVVDLRARLRRCGPPDQVRIVFWFAW